MTGKSDIDNIVLLHVSGSGEAAGKLSIARYAVFAAGTKDDLYDETKASFYHLYDNATEKKKYQNYKFSKNALTGVKYVGIEIYNPHIDWADKYVFSNGVATFYPRLTMFNVYGKAVPETVNVTYDDNEFLTAEEKGDLKLLSSSISAKSYRNDVQVASGKDVSPLIDEDDSTEVGFMQGDEADDRLISFIDKKTKAEISLVKLDNNDIFTNAVSARLVPEKATNRQMDSLMVNNFKVVGKTIYKVELLDLYGNVVTDIGERLIQVRFPIKKSEKGKMLIGDASNKTEVVGLDAFEVDNWICANISMSLNGDTKVALLKLTTSTDPYWSEIGELEDFEVEEEEEYRDETWYDSIHTTDGRFVVTPINDTYESGLKFTATDITTSKAYSDYYNVLEMATPDKQVAVFYDMKLTRNGVKVNIADGAVAEIAYAMPNFVVNGYTDLEAYHIDELGTVTPLDFWEGYNENEFVFQLEKMGQVAIVGTKLDGAEAGVIVGDSPETGESPCRYCRSCFTNDCRRIRSYPFCKEKGNR